uniref:cytochrome c oxidase subunit II n=1 Tax=Busonia albilateralis TaxID=2479888 RepID=UPI0024117E43|nr:cytochrome c oxidase subunit II [Busonia albilateralis]WEP24812.1 cytochrome c oxidase subunit II [Busonia albilateralis]
MFMWMKFSFQDPLTSIMEQLIIFHDHAMMLIMMVTFMVLYIMISIMMNKMTNRFLLEGQLIELIWTFIPAFMLIFIALPSLKILYLMEESSNPLLTVKMMGHQWYWSYEYTDFKKIEFDSYMKITSDLEINEFRLLDVDNRLILPYNINIRMLVSSFDVIHSWTVPSLGLKIDASPGRINQGNLIIKRPGLFFGQCSEICGSNHSFMPIVLESVKLNFFFNWLKYY